MSENQAKLAVLMGQTVNILATDTLAISNKLSFDFIQVNGVPTKITNVLFFSDFLFIVLTIDNEIIIMNYLKSEVVYREKIRDMRYYGGQMVLFNKKVVMNKMSKLVIVRETRV